MLVSQTSVRLATLAVPAALAFSRGTNAEPNDVDLVFACNYSLELTLDDGVFELSNHSRVRNGHAIPFDLQRKYKLEMKLSSHAADKVKVELIFSEKSDGTWYSTYAEPPSFVANLGNPTEFSMSDDFVEIDLALIVSKFPN